jgi:hypothetical protein
MKRSTFAMSAVILLVNISCSDAPTEPIPIPGSSANVTALAAPVTVFGEYDAVVDFTTLSLTPKGKNCLLQVDGRLIFSGAIQGVATGTTSALVHATCAQVATTPPGTFRDVFNSDLEFDGTIGGSPVQAHMMYQGRVQEGGQIEGRIIASRGASGVLDVDARVAVGGSYSGSIVVH